MGRRVVQLENDLTSYKETFFNNLKQAMTTSDSSRRKQYLSINPHLEASNFLVHSPTFIPEQDRIATTRLRLGSHHLRIETGRWSRTPLQNRTCICETGIQSEEHVLILCPMSANLRTAHNLHPQSAYALFDTKDTVELRNIAEYCRKTLSLFRT